MCYLKKSHDSLKNHVTKNTCGLSIYLPRNKLEEDSSKTRLEENYFLDVLRAKLQRLIKRRIILLFLIKTKNKILNKVHVY